MKKQIVLFFSLLGVVASVNLYAMEDPDKSDKDSLKYGEVYDSFLAKTVDYSKMDYDINSIDENGNTELHRIFINKKQLQPQQIKDLIKNGAYVTIKNNEKKSVLDLIGESDFITFLLNIYTEEYIVFLEKLLSLSKKNINKKQIPIIIKIIKLYAKVDHLVYIALSTNVSNCSICQESILNLDKTIKKTYTCTHYFHTDCINLWLKEKHNACPICRNVYKSNEKNNSNEMEILLKIINEESYPFIKKLLNNMESTNINAQCNDKNTILHILLRFPEEGKKLEKHLLKIFKIFIENGACLGIENSKRETSYDLIQKSSDYDILIKILLKYHKNKMIQKAKQLSETELNIETKKAIIELLDGKFDNKITILSQKLINENFSCCNICFGKIRKKKTKFACGATFHYNCINEYLKKEYKCPNCKKIMLKDELLKVKRGVASKKLQRKVSSVPAINFDAENKGDFCHILEESDNSEEKQSISNLFRKSIGQFPPIKRKRKKKEEIRMLEEAVEKLCAECNSSPESEEESSTSFSSLSESESESEEESSEWEEESSEYEEESSDEEIFTSDDY